MHHRTRAGTTSTRDCSSRRSRYLVTGGPQSETAVVRPCRHLGATTSFPAFHRADSARSLALDPRAIFGSIRTAPRLRSRSRRRLRVGHRATATLPRNTNSSSVPPQTASAAAGKRIFHLLFRRIRHPTRSCPTISLCDASARVPCKPIALTEPAADQPAAAPSRLGYSGEATTRKHSTSEIRRREFSAADRLNHACAAPRTRCANAAQRW